VPTLLQLDSSADLVASTSRRLTAAFAQAWLDAAPGNTVVRRDLHATPPPHLTDPALHWAPQLRLDREQPDPAAVAVQDELLGELLAADAVVIGVPMYHWNMPSTLKAWIDHIHVLGATASFGGSPKPLAGRPAALLSSSGAAYGPGSPSEGWDKGIPALELVLGGSLGMDVSTVACELTLASRIPAMAPMLERSQENLAEATRQAIDLAGRFSAGRNQDQAAPR
jgi:FMN-dependent NADH-azoreductase